MPLIIEVSQIPPITRALLAATLLATVAQHLGFAETHELVFSWPHVWQRGEWWRLLTCHLVYPSSLSLLFSSLSFAQFGARLENNTFRTDPAGFIYFLLLSAVFLMVAPAAIGHPLYFAGPSLDIAVLYLYSKHFQHENVRFQGLLVMPAVWVPFAVLAFDLMQGGDLLPDIAGIFAGHLFYYFTAVYPRTHGGRPLATPAWLKAAVSALGLPPRGGLAPAPAAAPERQRYATVFAAAAAAAAARGSRAAATAAAASEEEEEEDEEEDEVKTEAEGGSEGGSAEDAAPESAAAAGGGGGAGHEGLGGGGGLRQRAPIAASE